MLKKYQRKLWSIIHQSYFVVALCIGVILGVIVGFVFRINYFTSVIWLFVVGLLFLVMYLKPRTFFIIVAFIAGMILAWYRISIELYSESYIRQLYNKNIVVKGVIDGDPEEDEGELKLKINNLRFGREEKKVEGSIYMTLRDEKIMRADEIVVDGELLEGFGTYVGYMYKPKVISIKRPEPGDLTLRVRNWFADRIAILIPADEASLGLSYLLGMKTGLSDELSGQLRTVGLVHIVVASGAHLSILVEIARKIFGQMSRFMGLLAAMLFTLFFMAMVGWTPSIMRAGMMVFITMIMWYVGRRLASWRIIILVAAITLMINPNFIINLGWLLSFAAYGGIMLLGPWMTKIFYGNKKPGFIASTVITTLAATVMTLPISLYYYGEISLISVVPNLLILPTLSWAMGLVFMTGLVAGIPGIETVIAWCATKMLDFHILVVGWFGGMKQFLIKIPPYQTWVYGLYLVIVVIAVLYARQRKHDIMKITNIRNKNEA